MIKTLERLVSKHGNVPVVLADPADRIGAIVPIKESSADAMPGDVVEALLLSPTGISDDDPA